MGALPKQIEQGNNPGIGVGAPVEQKTQESDFIKSFEAGHPSLFPNAGGNTGTGLTGQVIQQSREEVPGIGLPIAVETEVVVDLNPHVAGGYRSLLTVRNPNGTKISAGFPLPV
jgi:hypothetical protein